MGISITEDIVEGAEFNYTPGQSGALVRRFGVEGLDPTNRSNVANACWATDATTGFFIPLYLSPHPDVPNFFAASYKGRPAAKNAKDKVIVEVTYKPPELLPGLGVTRIEILGSNGRTVSSRWAYGPQKGQLMVVGYQPVGVGAKSVYLPAQISPQFIKENSQNDQNTVQFPVFFDYVAIESLSPGTVLRFTRMEVGSPKSKSMQYRRTINSVTWQGDPPGTWLCTAINGRNIVQGGNLVAPSLYEVVYEFSSDPVDHWSQWPVYKDHLTGTSPHDIELNGSYNGYTVVQPYGQADFNQLGLPSAQ